MEVVGRWFGVRGLRFVRPALILTGADGPERRLLAELDDKPWAAEDGESWRAAFAVGSEEALQRAGRVELSVAPDVNVELRSGGVSAEGPIAATGRVSDPPTPPSPPATERPAPASPPATERGPDAAAPRVVEAAAPAAPRRRRARGVPAATPIPLAPEPAATPQPPPQPAEEPATAPSESSPAPPPAPSPPRPRVSPNRAADVERLTAKLRTAESALEREQGRRQELEQSLERERSESRRTVAELARARAELELARTAEREAADTIAELDASRRDNHELRGRHEALRSDHERLLRAHAELEEQLGDRTRALQSTREELAGERQQRREAESRATAAIEAAVESGHRPPVVHAMPHNPPLPRTDRPLNPSLRRSPWLRLLVVIVIAGVLLAVYLVLHSTVLH